MRLSPRQRRLESDLRALESLQRESSIFDFAGSASEPSGPVDTYVVRFAGPSFYRTPDQFEIGLWRDHEVMIRLGASYPRQAPALAWRTPIFHPNISSSGAVCLGGYSTFWVPSLHLDQLCEMLWDMIRLRNFDVKSPYNREAAAWMAAQQGLKLPLDDRPLRDLARDVEVLNTGASHEPVPPPHELLAFEHRPADQGVFQAAERSNASQRSAARDDDEILVIDAEVVLIEQPDVLYIE